MGAPYARNKRDKTTRTGSKKGIVKRKTKRKPPPPNTSFNKQEKMLCTKDARFQEMKDNLAFNLKVVNRNARGTREEREQKAERRKARQHRIGVIKFELVRARVHGAFVNTAK
eukprot:Rhum_TRINITY_DN14870_c2_g1::Rhum_TRINITY_DN14870_c2_g1_i1::g.126199::m.126199